MKIIARTLMILAAALVVVWLASALNSAGALGNLGQLGHEGFESGREFNGQPPTRPNFEQGGLQRGGFGRGRGDREGRGASVFDLAEITRSLVMMTVVIVVVVLASKLIKRLRPRRVLSESN